MTHNDRAFLAQPANDEGENAECKEDREKYRLSERDPALRLGKHRDEPKQIILESKQRSDEHDTGEEQPSRTLDEGLLTIARTSALKVSTMTTVIDLWFRKLPRRHQGCVNSR